MTIVEAKAVLGIPALWKLLNLPGSPATSCPAPWREDRKPSFSVSQNGKLWNDFATAEGGDAVAFLQRARGIDAKEACREFVRLAREADVQSHVIGVTQNLLVKRNPYLPPLHEGTSEELLSLSRLRGISVPGLKAAQQASALAFSSLKGHSAWIITDTRGRNFQARRLDGEAWVHIGDKKAWTLPGSQASWPIGIPNAALDGVVTRSKV